MNEHAKPRTRPTRPEKIRNPMAGKELSGIARRWPTYVMRAVFVGLAGLIIFHFWQTMTAENELLKTSDYANLGRALFGRFFWLQLALVMLAALTAGADMVTREARSGALDMLAMTRLHPKHIAEGKWKAAMMQTGSLVLAGLPVLAICYYLGGIGEMEVAGALVMTLSTAALGTAFALWASAKAATPGRAFLLGLGSFFGYGLLPLLALFMGGWPLAFLLPFVHPVYAAVSMQFPQTFGTGVYNFAWIPAAVISTLVTWRVVVWAGREIHKRISRGPGAAQAAPRPQRPGSRLEKVAGRWTRDSIGVWEDSPLLWKEMATRATARVDPVLKRYFVIYFVLFLLTCLLLQETAALGTFFFLGAIFVGLAVFLGANLFVAEREGRKLEVMLLTPLSRWRIVGAKLAGALLAPEGLGILALGTAVVAIWTWRAGFLGALLCIAGSMIFFGFSYVLAAAFSLRARTTHGAFMATAGILALMLIFVPFLSTILAGPYVEESSTFFHRWVVAPTDPTWVLGPLTTVDSTVTAADLRDTLVRLPAFAAFYIGVGGLLVVLMVRRLDVVGERG